MTTLEEHDLGECEDLFGYTCETCGIWYQERADEFDRDLDDRGQDWK